MSAYYADDMVTLLHGDALEMARTVPTGSVQTIVTSPPYFGLRDYGEVGQMGAEDTLDGYVAGMVALFSELRRTLADRSAEIDEHVSSLQSGRSLAATRARRHAR